MGQNASGVSQNNPSKILDAVYSGKVIEAITLRQAKYCLRDYELTMSNISRAANTTTEWVFPGLFWSHLDF
jgi:hypothetical protein